MARRIKYFAGQKETRPIKDPRQLQELFYYLLNQIERAKSPTKKYQAERNWMMILLGMNTAFRAEDLLQLRVKDVIAGYVSIKENKTGKMQNFKMNRQLHEDVKRYIKDWKLATYDYLFRGQKNVVNGETYILPVNRQHGHRIVTSAAEAIGIPFVFGLHSLRKTFGYQYIKKNSSSKEADGASVLTLMKMYNHDSPEVTLHYVCWSTDDAENAREATYIGSFHRKT